MKMPNNKKSKIDQFICLVLSGAKKMFTENTQPLCEQSLCEQLIQLRGYTPLDMTKGLVQYRDQKIQFYVCGTHKLDMAYFYKSYDQMIPGVTHLIFVYNHATIQIKKLKMYKDILRIEFFSVHELRRLLVGNRLIPVHRAVSDPTMQARVYQQFGKEKLPQLLHTDPIARLYDFELDSLIEIQRPDVVYYRLVVADE
jgi:DNA-directed RNA polymerase subunit H (RpoH/RPB5)